MNKTNLTTFGGVFEEVANRLQWFCLVVIVYVDFFYFYLVIVLKNLFFV